MILSWEQDQDQDQEQKQEQEQDQREIQRQVVAGRWAVSGELQRGVRWRVEKGPKITRGFIIVWRRTAEEVKRRI